MASNRENARDWDQWWRERLGHLNPVYDTLLTPLEGLKAVQFAPWFWQRGVRRVLAVGNGVNLVPHALAHCGFEVTALDVSSVATNFASQYALGARESEFFFQMNEAGDVGNFRQEYFRPGGSTRFVLGDYLDPTCEPGPFDMLLCWRATQHLEHTNLKDALGLLHHRLVDNACWDLSLQNDAAGWTASSEVLAALGYAINPHPWPFDRRFVRGGISSG